MYKIAFSLVKYFKWYGPRESVQLCVHGGTSFDWFVFVLEFKSIIPMSVQHIIFVGEVFQIEILDGLVNSLWESSKCKLVSSYGDYWGASFEELVCA